MPNAEATGAREALLRLLWIVERHIAGHIVRSVGATHEPADNEDRQYNDLMQLIVDVEEIVEEPSAPAPRKVRATVQCEFGRWELHHDAWMFVDHYGDPQDGGPMSRIEVGFMAERQARADAEGMVEEGLGAPTPKSAAPDAPAPSPTLKHRYVDRPPLVIDEGDTPSASPEADGRVWWLVIDSEGDAERVTCDPQDDLLGVLDRSQPMYAPHKYIAVVPRSTLARVQRERDDLLVGMQNVADAHSPNADHSAYMLQRAQYYLSGKRDAIESHFAGYRAELDYQKTENATLRAERDAALDRARVAEQRIEEADVCWQRVENGGLWPTRPDAYDLKFMGPFTRGRFVADTEET